jgi:hypothetical protein
MAKYYINNELKGSNIITLYRKNNDGGWIRVFKMTIADFLGIADAIERDMDE